MPRIIKAFTSRKGCVFLCGFRRIPIELEGFRIHAFGLQRAEPLFDAVLNLPVDENFGHGEFVGFDQLFDDLVFRFALDVVLGAGQESTCGQRPSLHQACGNHPDPAQIRRSVPGSSFRRETLHPHAKAHGLASESLAAVIIRIRDVEFLFVAWGGAGEIFGEAGQRFRTTDQDLHFVGLDAFFCAGEAFERNLLHNRGRRGGEAMAFEFGVGGFRFANFFETLADIFVSHGRLAVDDFDAVIVRDFELRKHFEDGLEVHVFAIVEMQVRDAGTAHSAQLFGGNAGVHGFRNQVFQYLLPAGYPLS